MTTTSHRRGGEVGSSDRPGAPRGGVGGCDKGEGDPEGCTSATAPSNEGDDVGGIEALDTVTPPGVEGVEEKACSSAIADSRSARTAGENNTPRHGRVDDGGGDEVHEEATADASP